MDATLFFSFNVSKIFFLIFRFSMCFCCSSDSIIYLAMCFLRHFIPCLIDNFTDANVGIKPSSLHFIIKSSLLLQCFLIGFSKFFVIFSISYPCFSLRTHRIAEPTFTDVLQDSKRKRDSFSRHKYVLSRIDIQYVQKH